METKKRNAVSSHAPGQKPRILEPGHMLALQKCINFFGGDEARVRQLLIQTGARKEDETFKRLFSGRELKRHCRQLLKVGPLLPSWQQAEFMRDIEEAKRLCLFEPFCHKDRAFSTQILGHFIFTSLPQLNFYRILFQFNIYPRVTSLLQQLRQRAVAVWKPTHRVPVQTLKPGSRVPALAPAPAPAHAKHPTSPPRHALGARLVLAVATAV